MFTAHIDDIDKTRIQSVAEHSFETAALAAKYAEKLNLTKTAEIQGLLHDLGKLCVDFDDYINERNNIKRGEIDHAFAGAKYLFELARSSDKNSVRIAAGYIARTIISHHGLHDWLDNNRVDYFDKRVSENKRYDEISHNISEIITEEKARELLSEAASEYAAYHSKLKSLSGNENRIFLFYSGLFERLLQSVLIDADRTNTADFMLGQSTSSAIDASKVWGFAEKNLSKKYAVFSKKNDVISKQRTKISERCLKFAKREVGICRLIVPTGGGKTLSSLRFAVEYCKTHKKERIFYIAPFMSILEQNSDVIKELVGAENFLEHYSDFANLINDAEELQRYELRSEKWDTPVISTTLVQFMNTIFSDKTQSVRRFHNLSNSVIILDEVQAIPIKCVNLFNLTMNFLSHICGSAIVLCTATQPAFPDTDYPIILDKNPDMNLNFKEDFEIFHRVNLISAYRKQGFNYSETAEFCAEKFTENGNLLLVVNTKSAAHEIYGLLKYRFENDNVKVAHLSTGMCAEHRREILKNIRNDLEKHEPIICVTTQLIEAGVDISFKCVVRSLAGLDNAAQSAGRCNRNGEYDVCESYIINIKDENLKNLQEIENRQKSSQSVIFSGKYPDLLDVETIEAFFKHFFHEQKQNLCYWLKDEQTTILDLLSENSNRNALAGNNGVSERIGKQAFKTAGMNFQMIEKNAEEIIVPYNDKAKEIISELNSDISVFRQAKLLRKAQKYCVSIYSYQKNKLQENNGIYLLKCGIFALKPEFYDSGAGLKLESANLDELIF